MYGNMHPRINVNTFSTDEDGRLAPFFDLEELNTRHQGHVPGFIDIRYMEQNLLGMEYRTDIFFWWAQIPLMVREVVVERKNYVTGVVPDLPVSMNWTINKEEIIWSCDGIKPSSIIVPRLLAMRNLLAQCHNFMIKMEVLVPEFPGGFSSILACLSEVTPLLHR